nr:reverse transcriptase domain-containing protein [Tanacetum cinerariifolium]
MDKVLAKQKGRNVETYLEEVVIKSRVGHPIVKPFSTSSMGSSVTTLALFPTLVVVGVHRKWVSVLCSFQQTFTLYAFNSELAEPLSELERTLNRRLRRGNRRVPFEQKDERPAQQRIIYLPILEINYFHHFLDILENYNPMDDKPMWVAIRFIASTLGFAITIPETANEFAIKAFANEGSSNSNTDKIMVRMDAMTMKIDARIDVIDEILEEDFDALLDDESKILHSIKGTILEEKLFAELDKFMAMDIKEKSESKTKEIPFENYL